MCKGSFSCPCSFNPQFPTSETRQPFGNYPSGLTPLLQQVIVAPIGLIQSGGFNVVGNGGYQLMSDVKTTIQGVGQLAGSMVMQPLTNQTKDF